MEVKVFALDNVWLLCTAFEVHNSFSALRFCMLPVQL